MKHPSTKELFEYWNARRGRRAAPDRADIEPAAIRRVLADTFILSYDERAGHPFRIAGTRVCAMFGRELKNESYAGLWTAECRQLARDLVTVVAAESVGVIASARGTGPGNPVRDLEVLLLPLSHRGRTDARVLGALAPARGSALWVGVSTLTNLTLGTLRYLGDGMGRPALRAAPDLPLGRRRHGFVVYDGGQA
jgi:hypothetical protein